MRDVIARLVSIQAARAEQPEKIFQAMSDMVDARIHHLSKGKEIPPEVLYLQEEMRKEVDWIVASAQQMLREKKDE